MPRPATGHVAQRKRPRSSARAFLRLATAQGRCRRIRNDDVESAPLGINRQPQVDKSARIGPHGVAERDARCTAPPTTPVVVINGASAMAKQHWSRDLTIRDRELSSLDVANRDAARDDPQHSVSRPVDTLVTDGFSSPSWGWRSSEHDLGSQVSRFRSRVRRPAPDMADASLRRVPKSSNSAARKVSGPNRDGFADAVHRTTRADPTAPTVRRADLWSTGIAYRRLPDTSPGRGVAWFDNYLTTARRSNRPARFSPIERLAEMPRVLALRRAYRRRANVSALANDLSIPARTTAGYWARWKRRSLSTGAGPGRPT